MSDKEADVPSAAAISGSIRDAVISIHKAGDDDNLTVNYVRGAAEEKLGLPAGLLKNGQWKDKSKQWIKEAVVCQAVVMGFLTRTNMSIRTAIVVTMLRQAPVRRGPSKQSPRQDPKPRKRTKRPPKVPRAGPRENRQPLRRNPRSEGRTHYPTKNQRLRYLIPPWKGVMCLGQKTSHPYRLHAD